MSIQEDFMQVTAELRWFWNTPQEELKAWFCDAEIHEFGCGGGGKRIDSYLRDAKQVELGLKHRGGRFGVEIKGLVAVTAGGCIEKPFDGDIELWTKWTSSTLVLDTTKTVTLEKQRWLRKFDTSGRKPIEVPLDIKESYLDRIPERGCSIEFTQIRFLDFKTLDQLPESQTWWTLSFESFGSIADVNESLSMVAAEMALRNPPPFDQSCRASYPTFLSLHAPEARALQTAN